MAAVGIVVCLLLAWVLFFFFVFVAGIESEVRYFVLAPLLFTVLAVLPAFVFWRTGKSDRRGLAAGLVIGWAGIVGAFVYGEVSWYLSTHGPAAVTAFDSRTGRRLWNAQFETANGVSTPTTWGELVLVQSGQSSQSAAGMLVALDARTGRQVWEVKTEGGSCGGAVFAGPPVVADGVAVVRGPAGYVRGINARDGGERWHARVAGAPAAVAGGAVIVGAGATYTALDVATGEKRWTQTVAEAASSAALPEDRAYVLGAGSVFIIELRAGDGFSIAALDARDGRQLWSAPVGSVDSTLRRYVVDGAGTVVALEGGPQRGPDSPELGVAARQVRTGNLLWRRENLPADVSGLPRTGVAAHAGHAFYASVAAGLVAVDAGSGSGRWTASFEHDDPLWPPLLMAGEDAVVVRQLDWLSVFDNATGVRRWTAHLDPGADQEVPAVGEGLVLVPKSSSPCMP
jgi:outer membrane protein assembly factor BamB